MGISIDQDNQKMIRKVFANGPSLVVTLPSAWVQKYGIKSGQELQAEVNQDKLSLTLSRHDSIKSVSVNGDGLDRTMLRCLIRGAYRKGFDSIDLHIPQEQVTYHRVGKTVSTSSVVRQEVNHLVGTEIVDEQKKSYTIKKISEDSKAEFNALLRRIFLRQVHYCAEIKKLIMKDNPWSLDAFESEYESIKSSISYILRIIAKLGSQDNRNDPMMYHIVSSLDLVNDLLKYAVRDVSIEKKPFSKETLQVFSEIHETFALYSKLFYDYSNEAAVKFSWKRRAIVQEIDALLPKASSNELAFLFRTGQIIEIIYFLIIDTMAIQLK